jgi:ABC-type sugar transport system permease subunit
LVFSLTDGGPGGATTTMALSIFRTGFGTIRQLGYASAQSVILFIMVAFITAFQISLFRRKEVNL